MSCHKLAVLLGVLSMACLASTAKAKMPHIHVPIDYMDPSDPYVQFLKSDKSYQEYEQELDALDIYYMMSDDVRAKAYMDWIVDERSILAKSRDLCKLIKRYVSDVNFWKDMDNFATYEFTKLKTSLRSRLSVALSISPFKKHAFEKIRLMMIREFGQLTLTKSLLNLRHSAPLQPSENVIFNHAIATALKYDAKKGLLTEPALRDIARSFFRVDSTNIGPPQPKTVTIMTDSPEVREYLSEEQIKILLEETETMDSLSKEPALALSGIRKSDLFKSESAEDVPSPTKPEEVVDPTDGESEHGLASAASCGYLPAQRRRRRSTSECLLSEEEYREIVRKVDEEGDVKEVLDTEKFLELLDRVTAEDSAAKRQQLLELGADLSENPEVSLEGDYITQFRETVKPMDQTVPGQMLDLSHSQLPENPMGLASPSESRALPLDHLSPGEIYPSHLADRISAYPQEILHEPINIHEPAIYPKEFGGLDFRVPEFHEQIKPVTIPEIIRPIEITPIEILPVPEVRLPIPKFRVPMIPRG